jgi:hypothetical protein
VALSPVAEEHAGRSIQVNVAIMRAFVQLRQFSATHKDLAQKVQALERKYGEHDRDIVEIFTAIKNLLNRPPLKAKDRIGFRTD